METLITHSFLLVQPEPGQETVECPAFALAYNGRSISDSIAANVVSIVYADKTAGEADELTIILEDSVGNWRRQWYPEKGAKLVCRIGYAGNMLDCGEFEIDEVHQAGPPAVVTIRALAAGFSKSLRTKRSKAHESQTLQQIAERIAGEHGLQVSGTIRPITIERKTQHASRDIKFLKRLALEYGYVFSIRGKRLVFTDVYSLENSKALLTIEEADLVSYSFTDKLSNTYGAAEVSYHNPKSAEVVRGRATGHGATSADTLKIHSKSESQSQAAAKARAALHRHNSRATESDITLPGNPLLVAGVSIRFGHWAGPGGGRHYLQTSNHTVSKSEGYTTECTGKRVGA